MKYFKLFILLLFTVQLSMAQKADSPQELTGLIGQSMTYYPKLKEAAEQVMVNQTKKDLAYAAYLPIMSAEATYRRLYPTPDITIPIPGQESKIQFQPANNYDAHFNFTQPIYDFGKTQVTINKSKVEIESAYDNLKSQKHNLAYQIAQVYYGIIYLNRSQDVQQQQIDVLLENEKIIRDRIKNGDALEYDLLSTQVRTNAAKNRMTDIQASLHKQYSFLNMLTGNSGEGYVKGADFNATYLNEMNPNPESNLDIKLTKVRLRSAEWDVKSAKRIWAPTLSANFQAGYKNGFVPTIQDVVFNYGAGATLSIPIFPSSRPYLQARIAKHNLNASKDALDAQKLTLKKDLEQTQTDWRAWTEKLATAEFQITQADRAVKLANSRYKNGVITNLELLTSQTNLQDALLNKLQVEYNTLLAKLELNRLGGVKFW